MTHFALIREIGELSAVSSSENSSEERIIFLEIRGEKIPILTIPRHWTGVLRINREAIASILDTRINLR